MASTYKTAGSPSKLLNHQFMNSKNRHIIHQFHFILQRTQRFGEIGWMEGSGGTSESKLPGQWVRNIPNASTAVGEIISGGILGESNPCLKVIIKCDLTWKVWIWAFQFLFFFSLFRIHRALTSSSNKNQPPKNGSPRLKEVDQPMGPRPWKFHCGCSRCERVDDVRGMLCQRCGQLGIGVVVVVVEVCCFFLGGSINWTIGVDQGWMAFLVWTLKVRWFFMFDVYDVWHFVVKRNEL